MSFQLHRNPPFRAEHLGSLLRTEKLLDIRHACEAGRAQQADLISIEDEDIKEIVKTQLELGFHAITDGEYRRHSMLNNTSIRDERGLPDLDVSQCSGVPFGLALKA